ncbi:hypothetical protein RJP21_15130 [Paenibacillus sp. VCA1]|uniref:alpha/beta fold hydrolase n=1 Tax=Paenibacillus sp. VCA1 TaxID=3039148 RepID=UPI0028710CCF|nr:hypothetical protein [Paenibacillus sp. VCA1]MDR9854946.1 hypothetical protein [Paenibacillus sp. VCA1]
MVRSGFVKTEGDELYYEVRGEGELLLMITGVGGDAGFYTYVADILADEYQVITYDRRGNSRSSGTSRKISKLANGLVMRSFLYFLSLKKSYLITKSKRA